MGKFGKKNVVSSDLSDYMLGIIGPSGFGKSTLMFNVCNKLYGDEGYMILDVGTEDGIKAIGGAVCERVPNYGTLNEIVTDIVKNKQTDYPNLKVVVIDTLDEYFGIVEEYVIKDWNASNANTPNFVKAKSINSVEGGFGRGIDRVIDVAKKIISRLNAVGVGVWWAAHIKEKDMTDAYTGATYTQLTANMSKRYFDSVKNSSHVVACGYYDRAIEKVEVGDKNPVTGKKKQRGAITDETRKVKFRDDMLIADAKSRLKYIVDDIPLDADAFIKAITDAIKAQIAENNGEAVKPATTTISTPKAIEEEKPVAKETVESQNSVVDQIDVFADEDNEYDLQEVEDVDFDKDAAIAKIRELFKDLPKETKLKIKSIKGENQLEALGAAALDKILKTIDEDTKILD